MRYALVIDLLKCMGCSACTVACKAERGTPPGVLFTKVRQVEVGAYPTTKMKSLPMSCMHCKDPRCLEACDTEATFQREDGIVLVDKGKCIGCGACIIACPYGSRTLVKEIRSLFDDEDLTPYEAVTQEAHKEGTAVKCDFCLHRLEDNRLPACVETCPAQARTFGDRDDPESDVSKLLVIHKAVTIEDRYHTEPCVFYIRA